MRAENAGYADLSDEASRVSGNGRSLIRQRAIIAIWVEWQSDPCIIYACKRTRSSPKKTANINAR